MDEEQTAALRHRAREEGRSMRQVVPTAIEEYLIRTADDEVTERLAEHGAQRFAELLRRLGE